MAKPAIILENISKRYRLGMVGSGTLREDVVGWYYKVRGKEDPYSLIAETNNRAQRGSSNYVWALKDINFSIEEGEVLGVIGKNGAGKSTLLKLLSRVTAPTTGSIKARGRIASLLEVGTGFHPELSGRDNIFLNGAIMGMRRAEIKSKFDEIVDFAGVERYIDTPVKRYSSGMYVRLAFAVAAHLEPEILIVDEVLAVGDAQFQKKAIGKMKDVSQGQGRTVLFVSHNMASIRNLCRQTILLSNGTIQSMGNTSEIVSDYLAYHSDNHTHQSLKEAKRFEGNLHIEFSTIATLNSELLESQTMVSGEPMNIRLGLAINAKRKYSKLHCSVSVANEQFVTIMHLSTDEGMGESLNIEEGVEHLTLNCLIDQLALPRGKYYLSVFIWDKSVVFDHILHAKSFFVSDGNFFGNGAIKEPRHTMFLVKNQWTQMDQHG